jgi:eukaryotic-like serine/threonine-protein kinase
VPPPDPPDEGDLPTVAASPRSRLKRPSDAPSAAGATATGGGARTRRSGVGVTVIRAMHAEEAERASAFGRAVAILCVAGLAGQIFLLEGRALWLHRLMSATLAALFGIGAWVWRRARDPRRYTRRTFRFFACACVAGSLVIQYYSGIFSPAPLLVTMGIAFFGLGNDEIFAVVLPVVAAAAYLALAVLLTAGAIPDAGLFPSADAPLAARIFMTAIVPSVLLVTLWQARLSRRATLEAIQRSNDAILLAQNREALLDEANQNLDLALRAGAGRMGRYTGAIAGKYRLDEVIGRGAMGEIYAAQHVEAGTAAAVKLLLSHARGDRDLFQRFLREGRLAARLSSPNVVTVFDVGEAEDGAPYIAMELLRGEDLSALLRREQQLDLARVVDLVDQIAHGLAAAHAAAIVHRDLKPQNVFAAERPGGAPVWKILDFGVSKLQGGGENLTQHAIIGTPGYMAPEQAQGRDADHRADLFALGAVAYRALTGRPPFRGGDTPQILFDIVYKSPTRPADLVRGLGADVELVLALALAKRPGDRFESARAFAEALRAATSGKLDAAHRARGTALLAAEPWGHAVADAPKRRRDPSRP